MKRKRLVYIPIALLFSLAVLALPSTVCSYDPVQTIIWCCDHSPKHCGKNSELQKLTKQYECKGWEAVDQTGFEKDDRKGNKPEDFKESKREDLKESERNSRPSISD